MKIAKLSLLLFFAFGKVTFSESAINQNNVSIGSALIESQWNVEFSISKAFAYTQSECDYLGTCDPGQDRYEHFPVGGSRDNWDTPPIYWPEPDPGNGDDNPGNGDGGGDGGDVVPTPDPRTGLRDKCIAEAESGYNDCLFEVAAAAAVTAALCTEFFPNTRRIAACEAANVIAAADAVRDCGNREAANKALCAQIPE